MRRYKIFLKFQETAGVLYLTAKKWAKSRKHDSLPAFLICFGDSK